jgi:diacylglycerol kinase
MKRFLFSLSYAIKGIRILFSSQKNAHYHGYMALIVCIMGWIFHISSLEWVVLIACIGLVLFAECLNTTIEFIIDFISPDYHIKAGQIKDLAAGSVLILSITTFIIGLIIFIPKVWPYFKVITN